MGVAKGADAGAGGICCKGFEAEPPLLIGIETHNLAADLRVQGAVNDDQPVLDRRLERQRRQPFQFLWR